MEVPGLLERLAEVPDPRDPRGVRHALVVVLALTACAVPAGAAPCRQWVSGLTDAPPSVLERLGVRPDPLPRSGACRRRSESGSRLPPVPTRPHQFQPHIIGAETYPGLGHRRPPASVTGAQDLVRTRTVPIARRVLACNRCINNLYSQLSYTHCQAQELGAGSR
ncbi:transposase family protein [Streptomyces sp. NPDC055140]